MARSRVLPVLKERKPVSLILSVLKERRPRNLRVDVPVAAGLSLGERMDQRNNRLHAQNGD